MKKLKVVVFANWAQGRGALSGGDNIYINLFKKWTEQNKMFVRLCTSESGRDMCTSLDWFESQNTSIELIGRYEEEKHNRIFLYIFRTLKSIKHALTVNYSDYDFVYSSSDFWPDMISGVIIKLKNKKIKWIGSIYLFAPNPFIGFEEGGKKIKTPSVIDLFYYLSQIPSKFFTKLLADKICITSEPDIPKIGKTRCRKKNFVIVKGGVNIDSSRKYMQEKRFLFEEIFYDACFLGRFHRQKGVVQLVDIWNIYVKKYKRNGKLVMIGDGPLMDEIKSKIQEYRLEENIDLVGAKMGEDKDNFFKRSRIVLHPAVFDSGGMASAEAMAFGLPVVGYDLVAFKTYYPKGMLKTEVGNQEEFAKNIDRILNDEKIFNCYRNEAIELVNDFWDYDKRAKILYQDMFMIK